MKIVSESLKEFNEIEKPQINEGLKDLVLRSVDLIKGVFKKAGDFFITILNNAIAPVMMPTNMAIMFKKRLLGKAITIRPDISDVEMDRSLQSLTSKDIILNSREPDDPNLVRKYVERNIRMNESVLNEIKVPLEWPKKGDVIDVGTDSLIFEIQKVLDFRDESALMIWGAPGIGKTQIVKAVLEAEGEGRIIDVQTSKMMPDDWTVPAVIRTEYNALLKARNPEQKKELQKILAKYGKDPDLTKPEAFKVSKPVEEISAIDIPKSWLPAYKPTGDPEEDAKRNDIANLGGGGILFLDELSRAAESVQGTCLKLVNERIIGEYTLGSKWAVIAASNREIDEEQMPSFSKALASRHQQVNFVPDFLRWKVWAIQAQIDPRILDFLEFNEDFFYTLDTDYMTFASPRSWRNASREIEKAIFSAEKRGRIANHKDIKIAVAGAVGEDIAIQFLTFMELLERFSTKDIKLIFENPEKAKLPTKVGKSGKGYEQSEANALVSVLCSYTKNRKISPEEWENYVKYLIRLDNASLATKGARLMAEIHPEIHLNVSETDKTKQEYLNGLNIFVEKYGDILRGTPSAK
jgi:MoxR-like ATPase